MASLPARLAFLCLTPGHARLLRCDCVGLTPAIPRLHRLGSPAVATASSCDRNSCSPLFAPFMFFF